MGGEKLQHLKAKENFKRKPYKLCLQHKMMGRLIVSMIWVTHFLNFAPHVLLLEGEYIKLDIDPISIYTLCEPCHMTAFVAGLRCSDRIGGWMRVKNFSSAVYAVLEESSACHVCHPDKCKFSLISPFEVFQPQLETPRISLRNRFARWIGTIKPKQHISYSLQSETSARPHQYNDTFYPYYQCPDRPMLPASIAKFVNFTTVISTNLKIIFMGDSIAIQLAQWFYRAVGVTSMGKRHILRYSFSNYEGMVLAPAIRGGGQVASWRITGMLSKEGENKRLPNEPGGGWLRADAVGLLEVLSLYELRKKSRFKINQQGAFLKQKQDSSINETHLFDAMVFRPPHGWLKASEITERSLQQTVSLAHELFGVKTVIFTSAYLTNNVQTIEDHNEMYRANARLRRFANSFKTTDNTSHGVLSVLVLELGQLINDLVKKNAEYIGYDTSNQNYTLNHIFVDGRNKSIPLVCSKQPTSNGMGPLTNTLSCEKNLITHDGMHFCMETLAGRINAGIACLLGCVYNPYQSNCEMECNSEYMRLYK